MKESTLSIILGISFVLAGNVCPGDELPPPEFSIIDIETAHAPNFVTHKITGSAQYLVAIEPHLIEVFRYSPGIGIVLVDSKSSDDALNKCALGHFNDDEYWDLAVTEIFAGKIGIWLGSREGNLDYHGSFAAGADCPDRVVTGDFNEDGADDLIITSFIEGRLIVMLNTDGQGNFAYHTEYADGAGHQEAVVSDFNGDGHLDYIVTTQCFNETIQRFGVGNGYFVFPQAYSIGYDGYTSSLVPIDADTIPDYICGTGHDIKIFEGRASGVFKKTPTSFGTGYGAIQYRCVAGDFNGDGNNDVCSFITGTNSEPNSELQFWYGNGAGDLYPSERVFVEDIAQSRDIWPVAADLNKDSKTDILITCDDPSNHCIKLYIMD